MTGYKVGDTVQVCQGPHTGAVTQVIDIIDGCVKLTVDKGALLWPDEYLRTINLESFCVPIGNTFAIEVLENDNVDHPPHYTANKYEVIDIIEEFFHDNFHLGNVFKYIARCEHKGKKLEDLKKARWYLDRYIKKQEEHIAS